MCPFVLGAEDTTVNSMGEMPQAVTMRWVEGGMAQSSGLRREI